MLDKDGNVLDVTPDGVGLCRMPGGSRLVFRGRALVPGAVPAWELDAG